VDLWALSLVSLAAMRVSDGDRLVVHVHLAERGSLRREGSVLLLARRLGLPTVATVHISQLDQVIAEDAERFTAVLRSADRVHVLGPTHATRIAELLGSDSHITVIPNAVTLPDPPAHPDRAPARVLFAGEIGTRKGVDVLLDAWPRVRAEVPDAELILAGLFRDVEPPVTPGVKVLGATEPQRVASLMLSSRCAVLPSRHEAMPMFLLEAMAAGLPVVATPVGDVASVVPQEWIVPVGDAGALASAMCRLLSDAETAAEVGAQNRRLVEERFSVSVVHPLLDATYEDVHSSVHE
jgi:glycosyltransferase involved in cell wall biosynthesis